MDETLVKRTLERQHGVIARFQLRAAGARPHDVERLLRRDLVRIHPGVYLNHTGRPSRAQRECGAVLHYWPAVLGSFSAVALDAWRREPHVIVDVRRTVKQVSGVTVSRRAHFRDVVRMHPFPPRQRFDEAALDAAASLGRVDEVFTFLADVVQSRRTTADRLAATLAQRQRIRRRAMLASVLADLAVGASSVLEREWLRLEQRHGLPVGSRQEAFCAEGRSGMRDVVYRETGVVVDLDGRAFHDTAAARNADARRDLLAATTSLTTVRLTYGQVFGEGCQTVARVALLLQNRGWRGKPMRCPTC